MDCLRTLISCHFPCFEFPLNPKCINRLKACNLNHNRVSFTVENNKGFLNRNEIRNGYKRFVCLMFGIRCHAFGRLFNFLSRWRKKCRKMANETAKRNNGWANIIMEMWFCVPQYDAFVWVVFAKRFFSLLHFSLFIYSKVVFFPPIPSIYYL